jgi:hypothetical protein
MYIHPLFLLIPILAIALMIGTSLAIVGSGNRKIWLLVAPVVSAIWISTGILLARLTPNIAGSFDPLPAQFLVAIFFFLGLPVVLCICAFIFRKSREVGH